MTNYYTNSLSFKDYMSKTYSTVALGLLLSAVVSFIVGSNFNLLILVANSSLILLLLEIGIAIYFSARLIQMKKSTAYLCYFLYSFITGLTLGAVVYSYALGSVVMAFATTTVLFACMAVIGKTTNVDFTKYSSLISIGMLTLLIVSLLNGLLFHSSATDMLITYAMVIIFLVLIAMDTQQLRRYYNSAAYDDELNDKLMIMGAFQLYLDFINLFLRILSIFGKRKDD